MGTAIGWVKLTDEARRRGVRPELALAVLRTLHAVEPGSWPHEMVGGATLVTRATADRLMTFVDRVHRPTFRNRGRSGAKRLVPAE